METAFFAGHGRSVLSSNGVDTVFAPAKDAQSLVFGTRLVRIGSIVPAQWPEGCFRVLTAKGGHAYFGTWRTLDEAKEAAAAILSGAEFPPSCEEMGFDPPEGIALVDAPPSAP